MPRRARRCGSGKARVAMPRLELEKIQRWMQTAIIAAEEPSASRTRRMIRASATMTPEDRLDVYRGMYVARLNEALRADYPALAELLGSDLFDELTSMYVREHPSRSYTLNGLGAALPGFLARLEGLPSPGFARDLARFELTQAQVFDEEETEPLTPDAVAAVTAEAWPEARLRPVAAFRLLELEYPVHLYVEAVKREAGGPRPVRRRKQTRLAVFRRNYAVTWIELSKPAFGVLRGLAEEQPLGEALGRIRDDGAVFRMFQQWMTAGIFQSISV